VSIPKVHNCYRVGIENNVIDLNSNIIRANINEGSIRNKYQKEVLVNIAMIDLYLGVLLDLNIVNKKKFMSITRLLNEIKKMCMSWINNEKLYLFKVGDFSIFINEDAEKISKITTLKIIKHAKDVIKCGFPMNSLDKYLDIFTNLNIDVEVIDDIINNDNKLDKYLRKINNIDINKITPIECFKIVCELKDIYRLGYNSDNQKNSIF